MIGALRLTRIDDLVPGGSIHVIAHQRSIAVFNLDGVFHAVDGLCPHAGAPLADGYVDGHIIMCPWHGWRFDLRDGRCEFIPGAKLRVYKIEKSKGWLWALIDD